MSEVANSGFRGAISSAGLKILFLLSPRREIDGLSVVVLKACEAGTDETFRRVAEAMTTIRENDEGGFRRVGRYLERIVVTTTRGSLGWYWHGLHACFLDPLHVAEATAAELAMTIIHETAHARIRQRGIVWTAGCRPRVEAICIRAEIQLAASLSGGLELMNDAMERRRLELARASSGTLRS